MPNALAQETSPYLRQHADNPVDWLPWGEAAIERARREDKPLLVSIGYAACHWCHVMERESFSDPQIAALMNENFVCVKVDREERPDVDALCMEACQAMTGHGGWPLNVFMTPELVPFFAGTYFPPQPRDGMPSWRQVLEAVAATWRERRQEIRSAQTRIAEQLAGAARLAAAPELPPASLLDEAIERLRARFDRRHGGFGGAPKFPPSCVLAFLLARGEREMSELTLERMALGGLYDQVGGGFHRYAVDARWAVPHFEKMLYDNALLARVYLRAWQALREPLFREVACETLDWALREMRGPEGGFYSSLDADSEGQEGRFYTWTLAEFEAALGDHAGEAAKWFGVTSAGNFEGGRNVLSAAARERPPAFGEWRARLAAVRDRRPRPATDDKRICSWNALMVSALAETGAVLERDDYLEAARAAAQFLLGPMRPQGRLKRTWKDGHARIDAFLPDYAHLLEALIALYEATFEPRWYRAAHQLADELARRFHDPQRGGFFETAVDTPSELPVRRKEIEDHPLPSGNAAAATALLRLHALSGEDRWRELADSTLRLLGPLAGRHPEAFGQLLLALDFRHGRVREVALVADDGTLARVVRARYRPHVVLAGGDPDDVPLLAGRDARGGRPTAYVCEGFVCREPTTDPEELASTLAA